MTSATDINNMKCELGSEGHDAAYHALNQNEVRINPPRIVEALPDEIFFRRMCLALDYLTCECT